MKKVEPIVTNPQGGITHQKPTGEPLLKELEPVKETKVTINLTTIIFALAIIVVGVITGYVLASGRTSFSQSSTTNGVSSEGKIAKVVGIECKNTGEVPEGIIKKGGIDGEGSHHLERDGGPEKYVYLTSSVISLDDYVNKKVRLCGTTYDAEKAGWFMDVERLEVLE